MKLTSEAAFEAVVAKHLIDSNGFLRAMPDEYDWELCMLPRVLIRFLQVSQPEKWKAYTAIHGPDAAIRITRRAKEIVGRNGTLQLLRKGLDESGHHFDLCFFKPSSGLNPDLQKLYQGNLFHVLYDETPSGGFKYSLDTEQSVDLGLFLNGLPVFTCKLESWSTRTLSERINSMLYERTAISKKPEETIKRELQQLGDSGQITPDLVFRDPYFLDFLNLKDSYSEKDLESAIVAELQRFIIELGSDFAFMARQKRIPIDNRDYYLDLLFYHRRLKAMVAIDLKLGEFDAAYKGQMELYLAWLEKHESVEGENPPIGLIPCAGKNPEHVELLQLHKSNIKVADYFTILPSKEVLMDKYHKAIAIARNSLALRQEEGCDS